MPTASNVTGAILAAIRESLEMKEISEPPTVDTPVDARLGLDSLDWAAIVVRLEGVLSIDPFEAGVDRELKTIQDIVDVYEDALRRRDG
ncbi:MAG: phosphopantetheine-binding protein [Acidobacteria bacterium]|nr:phosphopantetheine-binding protein [Acidobacteriota bacterium]